MSTCMCVCVCVINPGRIIIPTLQFSSQLGFASNCLHYLFWSTRTPLNTIPISCVCVSVCVCFKVLHVRLNLHTKQHRQPID